MGRSRIVQRFAPARADHRRTRIRNPRMAPLNLRRIDLSQPGAAEQLTVLRKQLSHQGEVVSRRGRELTVAVFGEALPPVRVVERICGDVRERGLNAVLDYTGRLDRVRLDASTFRVSAAEL